MNIMQQNIVLVHEISTNMYFNIIFKLNIDIELLYSRTSLQRDSEKRSDSQQRSDRWERSIFCMYVMDFFTPSNG